MAGVKQVREVLSVIADLASIGSALAIGFLALALTTFNAANRPGAQQRAPQASSAQRPSVLVPVDGIDTTMNPTAIRPSSARVAIVEFGDFECPFCGRYAREVYPKLKREYIDTGRVAYAFRHFPLKSIHPFAMTAAQAAECSAEQGRYWQMHQRLFAEPGRLSQAVVRAQVAAVGLDHARFDACLSKAPAAQIGADQTEGLRLGIRTVPTFLVGRLLPTGSIDVRWRLSGAGADGAIRSAIDQLLAIPDAQDRESRTKARRE